MSGCAIDHIAPILPYLPHSHLSYRPVRLDTLRPMYNNPVINATLAGYLRFLADTAHPFAVILKVLCDNLILSHYSGAAWVFVPPRLGHLTTFRFLFAANYLRVLTAINWYKIPRLCGRLALLDSMQAISMGVGDQCSGNTPNLNIGHAGSCATSISISSTRPSTFTGPYVPPHRRQVAVKLRVFLSR